MDIAIKFENESVELKNATPSTICIDDMELRADIKRVGSAIRHDGYYIEYKDEATNGPLPEQILFAIKKREELFNMVNDVVENFKKNVPDGINLWLNATQPEQILSISVDLGKNYE